MPRLSPPLAAGLAGLLSVLCCSAPPSKVDAGASRPDSGSNLTPGCADRDGDGFGSGSACGAQDCDDTNPRVFPGAAEVCNGVDDDCDGSSDNLPAKDCGVGACMRTVPGCSNKQDTTCTPGTPVVETCNGADDDCNGLVDDGLAPRSCGAGVCARTVAACVAGQPQQCSPGTPATETCNNLDDDCNNVVDDNVPPTSCGSGACARTVTGCVNGAPPACTPGTPSTETCNGVDDDCNGLTDDGLGMRSCGVGACVRTVAACAGGMNNPCTPGTPSLESCNNVDDDCNGLTDDGLTPLSCGVGACARSVAACTGGVPNSCTPGMPAASETCRNGLDDNCNGSTDEGCPANDLCTSPTPISLSLVTQTLSGDTTNALADMTGSCSCTSGRDLFYGFTLTQTEYVYANTYGVSWDTSLYFTDGNCTALPARTSPEAVCSDDSCSTLQSAVFAVLAPGTYRLAVDGCSGGAFTLRFAHYPVGTDGNGGQVPAGTATLTGTLSPGAGVTNPAGCGGGGRERSFFWMTCPAAASATFTASLCSTTPSFDSYLTYVNSSGTSSCNDDACGLLSSLSATTPNGAALHVLYVDTFSSATLSAPTNFSAATTR